MNTNMEAIVWAMHAKGLEPVAYKILLKLAARVNSERGDFDVWPSNRQIAEDAETSVATVKRHMPILVEEGYLKILPQVRKDGATSVNRIRLLVRVKHIMPKGREIDIDADSMDHEMNRGGAHIEPGPGALVNPANEPLEDEPIQLEQEPPPPTGGHPQVDDLSLFGGALEIDNAEPVPLEDFVVEHWHRLKADFPGVADIDVLNDSRRTRINARANEVVRERKKKGIVCTPEQVWLEIFERIRGSSFLTGRDPPGKNYSRPMKLTIEYVLRPRDFLAILDRDDATGSNHDSHAADGRRYGPAEQATRRALARLQASR